MAAISQGNSSTSTKRPFDFLAPLALASGLATTMKIGLEEAEGAIRESVCSPGSPTKRSRPSRLQVDEMGSGGVDPFPSLGTPLTATTTIPSAGRTLAPVSAATLEKVLLGEEAHSNKSMRRSFLAPLELDDDAGVDPVLPSFAKTGHPILGVCGTKPWEEEGDEIEGRENFLGFDEEDEHIKLQQLASQLAALGK